jgi:hypothetical protein
MVPGTLPLSAINLVGASRTPRPALVVAFKYFYLNPADLRTAIQISDTGLQEGQGMHGGFGRDSTYNNMAAIGPDFRQKFVDPLPAGNSDLTPTLAHLLSFELPHKAPLVGRVLDEALIGGAAELVAPPPQVLRSAPANGRQTAVVFQDYGGVRYLERGCFVTADMANSDVCR